MSLQDTDNDLNQINAIADKQETMPCYYLNTGLETANSNSE